MPAALVAKLAESTDIDIAEAEKRWNQAKAITTEEKGLTDKDGDAFWQYVTGVFKRSMGIGAVMESASVEVDDELLRLALADTKASSYRHEMANDAQGVLPGKLRELDRRIKAGEFTLEDVAKGWQRTRQYLRAKYGSTLVLHRADAPASEHHPDTLTAYFGDKSLAKRFEGGGRKAAPYRVRVADIVAVYATPSDYYEFIVKKPAGGFDIITESATSEEIHAAAHEAATSHLNDLPQPTQAQLEAGNYAKGHIRLHGLDISVENPKGSTRKGVDPDGAPWETVLPAHYGDVRGTLASDGDPCDVYIGDYPESDRVYVIDQIEPRTGIFDEHKSILGARTLEEARNIYHGGFSDGSGPDRIGAITEVSVDDFKAWLRTHKTKKPMSRILESAESGFRSGTKAPEKDGVYLLQSGKFARFERGGWYREFADKKDAAKTMLTAGFMSPQFRTRSSYGWRNMPEVPAYVSDIQAATSVADIETVFREKWPEIVKV